MNTAPRSRAEVITTWGLGHWLAFANGFVLLYGGLPWLSALLRGAGYQVLGLSIFFAYRPLCHQLPDRSFALNGVQIAFCHRDAAIWSVLFAGGVAYAVLRRRVGSGAPLWLGGLLLLPILLDGGSHMLDDMLMSGWRGGGDAPGTPNYWLRMLTGALAALAVLLVVYPRLNDEFCGNAQAAYVV